eukprot:UN28434
MIKTEGSQTDKKKEPDITFTEPVTQYCFQLIAEVLKFYKLDYTLSILKQEANFPPELSYGNITKKT